MIEARCPTCGGKVLKPDPPARTQEEKVEFRKRWDILVAEGEKVSAQSDKLPNLTGARESGILVGQEAVMPKTRR